MAIVSSERVQKLVDAMPDEAFLEGYGGMSKEWETAVFFVHYPRQVLGFGPSAPYSTEVRFPIIPRDEAGLEEIEREYGCFAANDWDDLKERYSDE